MNLSDQDLVSKLKALVSEERRLATQVLEHLHEVDRRRLFAEFGCASLWEFCTHELGYSEGAAHRRIAAMRVVRDVPEMKMELREGAQNLSSLAQAQKFFRLERKHVGKSVPRARKLEVLRELRGKSTRECERTLLRLSSVPVALARPERERAIDETNTELKFVVDRKLLAKLKRIQALRSHACPSPGYAELLGFMADEVLRRLDPEVKAREKEKRLAQNEKLARGDQHRMPADSKASASGVNDAEPPPAPEVRARMPIPSPVRREVWLRDRGQCVWRHPRTGKICEARHFLEIDHVHPVAWGGTNELSNLRLLCRAHNQRAAVLKTGIWRPKSNRRSSRA